MSEADTTNTGTPPAGNEGERTFAGFKTVEELEAAYTALQAPAAPGTNAERVIPPKPEGDGTDAEVTDALKSAGLDQSKYTNEFAETGELSEDSYTELAKAGFPREMVARYVRGLREEQSDYESALHTPAGGKDAYTKLVQWASANLDDADIKAYNDAITSGDVARAKLAVTGLVARSKADARPALLNGKSAASDGVKPFASRAQVNEAMRDPRYRTDPAYRTEVAERLRVSDVY